MKIITLNTTLKEITAMSTDKMQIDTKHNYGDGIRVWIFDRVAGDCKSYDLKTDEDSVNVGEAKIEIRREQKATLQKQLNKVS